MRRNRNDILAASVGTQFVVADGVYTSKSHVGSEITRCAIPESSSASRA
jgi:hypothetical protein